MIILEDDTPLEKPRKPVKEPADWTEYFEALQNRLYQRRLYFLDQAASSAREKKLVYLHFYAGYQFLCGKNEASDFIRDLESQFRDCSRMRRYGYIEAVLKDIENLQKKHIDLIAEKESSKTKGKKSVDYEYKNWWNKLFRWPSSFKLKFEVPLSFHHDDQDKLLYGSKTDIVKYLIKYHVNNRMRQHILDNYDFSNMSKEELGAFINKGPDLNPSEEIEGSSLEPSILLLGESGATTSQQAIAISLINETYKLKRHQDKKPLVELIKFLSGKNAKNISKNLAKYDAGGGLIHKSVKQNLEDYKAVRKIFQRLENQTIIKVIDERIKQINELSDK